MRLIQAASLIVIPVFSSIFLFAAELKELKITAVESYKDKIEHIGEVDRTTVVLSNGQRRHIPLFRAKPIAVLRSADGSHSLLVEGADCVMCDEPTTIRFFSLGPGELKISDRRYPYPGTQRDFRTHKQVTQTRVFYGRCIGNQGDIVVWFEERVGNDGQWRKVKSIVRPFRNGETLTTIKDPGASLVSILRNVGRGLCKEMAGVDGVTEP